MKLTLDVENTVTHRGGKLHLDPFEENNKLVMVGCLTDTGKEYLFRDDFTGVQELLDDATILIGHNIVHDLLWLWECGFKYDGSVFDTMLGEYILQRGQKEPLSLEACAIRHDLDTKKQDTMKEYFKNNHEKIFAVQDGEKLFFTRRIEYADRDPQEDLFCFNFIDSKKIMNEIRMAK